MKVLNQQIIKNNNLKELYDLIYQEPGISRAKLAKVSGLSKPTVSALTEELIKKGFIQDTGISHEVTTVGRKPSGLHLLRHQHYVAVISWYKDEMAAKLIDICGETVKTLWKKLEDTDSYIKESRQMFEQFCACISREKILGVCIIVPAMLDVENGEIFSVVLKNRCKEDSELKHVHEVFSDVATAVVNDTACAAYAEKIFGGITESDYTYINFQDGIGAVVFINDQLLGKATASFTQFGHYSIDPNGPECRCGNRGCLELYVGEHTIRERLLTYGTDSSLTNYEKITYKQLDEAAQNGDPAAVRAITDISREFSLALSNFTCIVRPQLIVLGGRGKTLGQLFLSETEKNMATIGYRWMQKSIQLRYSRLEPTAYFAGGMKYFFDKYYDFAHETSGEFYIG